MNQYALTFLFTPDMKQVWLIEKNRPSWQAGCLNGIGGKIEKDELPPQAATRELKEETGIEGVDIKEVGHMFGTNNDGHEFIVFVYAGFTEKILRTMESEKVLLVQVDKIKNYKHIENVPAIIEMCLYMKKGMSNFSRFIMEY